MEIPINDKYRLNSDECQWIVQKRRSRKGKVAWTNLEYHSRLDSAVRSLGELMVRRSKANTLVDALKEVETIATTLSQALTPHIEGLDLLKKMTVK
jgi:hypothetical protein